MLEPTRDVIPVVRPKAAGEIVWQWVERFNEPCRADTTKLFADHYASVADYWAHKRRHPDGHAGAMVALRGWAPVVIGVCGVLTCNPVVAIPVVTIARERNRPGPRR
ncbi:MAG: hypothetical protein JO213_12075 [Alphaproteobacteria bacterium]|nr:hypothetical protein [Alphaproteobacteria bacterium]MBV9964229.1 hypothetical protein [Alphaproteobacteria bacterium]